MKGYVSSLIGSNNREEETKTFGVYKLMHLFAIAISLNCQQKAKVRHYRRVLIGKNVKRTVES